MSFELRKSLHRNKAGKTDLIEFLIGAAIVVFLWQSFQGKPAVQQTGQVVFSGPNQTNTVNPLCTKEDTTLTPSALDFYDATLAILGNHRYKLDSKWQTIGDSATITTDPQAKVGLVFGDGNKSATAMAFSKPVTLDLKDVAAAKGIPCVGEHTETATLYRNGTLDVAIFNTDGDAIQLGPLTDATANQTLDAGSVKTLNCRLNGQYKRAAAPYGGRVVAEYNTSCMDDVVVSFKGKPAELTSTPTFYTVANTGHVTKSYRFPPVITSEDVGCSVILDADDTNNPLLGTFPGGCNVRLEFYPDDWFLNALTNEFNLDVQDENGNRLTNRPRYRTEIQVD